MGDHERMMFNEGQLETLCKIIADTNTGLTGSEIKQYLSASKIEDIDPDNTKWRRLNNAFVNMQNISQRGNCVLTFISKALTPTRFVGQLSFYKSLLEKINTVLMFQGLEFREDGKFYKVTSARTLSEAEIRVSKLKENIASRNLNSHLLKFCKAELLQNNYFHAVLEATKSISSMIREKTGLEGDGAALLDAAFSGSDPVLKINPYETESQKSEQKGFVNLTKGLFGTFRNPTAHSARIEWTLAEEDAVDLFTLASYVLRRIEKSS